MVFYYVTMMRPLSFSRRGICSQVPFDASRRFDSKYAADVMQLEPVPPSRFEELIATATPFFLGEEGMSRCFPRCTTGERQRAFEAAARKCLNSGLGVMARDRRGVIVGGHFSRPLHRDEVIGVDVHSIGTEIKDPQEKHILRFLTLIHQRLDLFSVLGVSEIVDCALMFVEKQYRGQGLSARMLMADIKQAAERGYLAAKGDCTSLPATKVVADAFTNICAVPYTEYTSNGEVIFGNAAPPDDVIAVGACRLQKEDLFRVELTESEIQEARKNYLAYSKNI